RPIVEDRARGRRSRPARPGERAVDSWVGPSVWIAGRSTALPRARRLDEVQPGPDEAVALERERPRAMPGQTAEDSELVYVAGELALEVIARPVHPDNSIVGRLHAQLQREALVLPLAFPVDLQRRPDSVDPALAARAAAAAHPVDHGGDVK